MTLRARLALVLALVVLVPSTVAAVAIGIMAPGEMQRRAMSHLVDARDDISDAMARECDGVRVAAEQLAATVAGASDPSAVAAEANRLTGPDARADVAAVLDATGRVSVLVAPQGTGRQAAPEGVDVANVLQTAPQCGAAQGSLLVLARVQLRSTTGQPAGTAVAGVWLGDRLVHSWAAREGFDVTLARTDATPVTTLPSAATADRLGSAAFAALSGSGRGSAAGQVFAALPLGGDTIDGVLIVSDDHPSAWTVQALLALAVLITALLAALVGWRMARVTTQPLEEFGDAAVRIAGGDLSTRLDPHGPAELSRMAHAFNAMTSDLRTYVGALEGSRDELRRNLTRLGETLQSTHDLDRILAVVLETAMASVRAEAGALLLLNPARDTLYLRVGRGLADRVPPGPVGILGETPLRIAVGAGVTGRVAATGEALRGRVGTGAGELELSGDEPRAESIISVPLLGPNGVTGVLDLYDRVDAEEFDASDLQTIEGFAHQASVAIGNVMVHEEAQRLSITDALTGLWNYRYLQMALAREVERASRFRHALSILVVDLDRFKAVNDTYGHPRGNVVLTELARRIRGIVREVDVLARYGGEEFVLLLPETDLAGAEQLAERLGRLVRAEPFRAEGFPDLTLTVSIGIAVYPRHGADPATLLASADGALYDAKESGRDCYRVAATTTAAGAAEVPPPGGRPDASGDGAGAAPPVPADASAGAGADAASAPAAPPGGSATSSGPADQAGGVDQAGRVDDVGDHPSEPAARR